MDQGESVIEFFARGVGCKVERLFEFDDGFDVRRRIFKEGFTQIAVAFDRGIVGSGNTGRRSKQILTAQLGENRTKRRSPRMLRAASHLVIIYIKADLR